MGRGKRGEGPKGKDLQNEKPWKWSARMYFHGGDERVAVMGFLIILNY